MSDIAERDEAAVNLASLSLDMDEDPSGSSETIDYSSMTVTELKTLAKERGITGYSGMTKSELIAAIESGD